MGPSSVRFEHAGRERKICMVFAGAPPIRLERKYERLGRFYLPEFNLGSVGRPD
jgi:hypothetical protein